MSINGASRRWPPNGAADNDAYLEARVFGDDRVARIGHSSCAGCGGIEFTLRADPDGCGIERTCTGCRRRVLMLDSAGYGARVASDATGCDPNHERYYLSMGYALARGGEAGRAYLAVRCAADGRLGVLADWATDGNISGEFQVAAR